MAGTISVGGSPRNDWGMWTDVATGSQTIHFGTVTGYTTPADQVITVNDGALSTVTGPYQ